MNEHPPADGAAVAPWPALAGPLAHTPQRRRSSIRRTTTIDGYRPQGPEGDVELTLRGRDLLTDADGNVRQLDACSMTLRTEGAGSFRILEVAGSRHASLLGSLIGASGKIGFRRSMRAALAEVESPDSVLVAVLDDVAILTSLSRVAYQQQIPSRPIRMGEVTSQIGICSGWRAGGGMAVRIERGESPMMTPGARAPEADRDDDHGWHEMPTMLPLTFRRARRLDIGHSSVPGLADVDGMFRDSYANAAGERSVVHEYSVQARVDAATRVLTACSAVPRALPGPECQMAVDSASRLVGACLSEVADMLRDDMEPEETCTHLTDHLRGMGAAGSLIDTLMEVTDG